jgi:hypothetical protein
MAVLEEVAWQVVYQRACLPPLLHFGVDAVVRMEMAVGGARVDMVAAPCTSLPVTVSISVDPASMLLVKAARVVP